MVLNAFQILLAHSLLLVNPNDGGNSIIDIVSFRIFRGEDFSEPTPLRRAFYNFFEKGWDADQKKSGV